MKHLSEAREFVLNYDDVQAERGVTWSAREGETESERGRERERQRERDRERERKSERETERENVCSDVIIALYIILVITPLEEIITVYIRYI